MVDSGNSLPLDQREKIDGPADQFERLFLDGQWSQIEEFLQQHPELRTQLLQELFAMEVQLRRTAGEQPTAAEYHRRREIIAAAFAANSNPSSTIDPGALDFADHEEPTPDPQQLGRYVIQRRLGRGGFGVVYLAHDPQLDRPVALKVPRRDRFQTPDQVAEFLKEARTAARLKHPALVAVHDVQEHDGLPFIVQEYVDGQNLGEWATQKQPSFEEIARVLAGVAEAVGYAHQNCLVHCDLKLANVLMDTAGQPHVADFGLAVHESVQPSLKGRGFGTPATMAPEQVRGEAHLLDGRTDIWAIGVIFYELLVGRLPFTASSRLELYDRIRSHDPKPPRQIDRRVPRELERICLKCLSKRRTERYNTTDDLSEDLRTWLAGEASTDGPQSTAGVPLAPKPDSSSGSTPPAKIIPKGLRSFDAEDADFFLELLPGPRGRDDLPESIRFWKNRIEIMDLDETFRVGLIYGPSGCGKSSLVKAGLLPRLTDHILPIYVEATADDTEVRLLKQLRKHIPRLPADVTLPQACAELRRTGAGRDRKVLLVIDQFEQWLHSHAELKNTPLVDSLRQCEGGRLQAVLLVRDDFYLSVNRVFQELEIGLLEGQNFTLVDRFDPDHSRKVLVAFGRAYGKLPVDLTAEHERFVQQAVDQLAEDHKVVSVRLALFAEMMKTRSWLPASLREVGGVGGVGVTFLDETFAAKAAPPSHRVHEKAIRGVLRALLPESGTDIQGSMRSADQLCEASGYHDKPQQFRELMQILDGEVRLITPTDPEGTERESDSKYYQLTHDYLIPSLRDWLTRKQRETRRGRAELRLAERAAVWSRKPEARNLPSAWEYLNIRTLTASQSWTPAERTLMRRAGRVHGLRWGSGLAAFLVVVVSISLYVAIVRQKNLVERVQTAVAATSNIRGVLVRRAIDDLEMFPPELVLPELRQRFASSTESEKLSLAYALAQIGAEKADVHVDFLVSQIRTTTASDEADNFATALKRDLPTALDALRNAAQQHTQRKEWRTKARLAIIMLHLGDSSLAAEMCSLQPDPTERSLFIDEYKSWHGDLQRAVELSSSIKEEGLRSAICLAVGSVPQDQATAEVKQAWQPIFSEWYRTMPDSGTHSAAGWALRHWEIAMEDTPARAALYQAAARSAWESLQRKWYVTEHGMTVLALPKGKLPVDGRMGGKPPAEIAGFWISDREVSVGLFQQFLDDPKYPSEGKPEKFKGADKSISPTAAHPIHQVSWNEAVLFCNWLSQREGLRPCYTVSKKSSEEYEVKLIPDGNGFRLPTEWEWEYACRAGTVTEYSCGGEELLREYAVYGTSKALEECGAKLPNGWGLFDVHGNVWELCWDEYANSLRVFRGGGWVGAARDCRSANRYGNSPEFRNADLGFRVARGPVNTPASSGAESGGR